MRVKLLIFSAITLFVSATVAMAVPTKITVKVKTKDAKFLGTSMGGAEVTIKDVKTDKLLAKGITKGSTGNTQLIMKSPKKRGVPISEGAAEFTATIDIDEPTHLKITAKGPLSELHAVNSVSVTQWVVPGKHIDRGDAMMLELPGLMVKLKGPAKGTVLSGTPQNVKIGLLVRMM